MNVDEGRRDLKLKRHRRLQQSHRSSENRYQTHARPATGDAKETQTATDSGRTTENPEQPVVAPAKRKRSRFVLLVVVPLLFIAGALYFYLQGGRYITTENAYVKSGITTISSDISGRTLSVGVLDNQQVRAGDILFSLDTGPLELRLNEAEAEMKLTRGQIESLRAEYIEATVSVKEAEDRIGFLRRQFNRQKSLRDQGIGSGQAYDRARFELNNGNQRIKVLQEATNRILAQLGGGSNMAFDEHPSYLIVDARYEQIQSELERSIIRAPSDGIISNMNLQIGEYIDAGEPVFSLIQTENLWVEANLKETRLTHVREGQEVVIKVDAYPGVEWQARVSAIAPATGAEFSLLPPQNATGNWVKVVQRVPVMLELLPSEDTSESDPPVLRAGMTATVTIDTGHQRELW